MKTLRTWLGRVSVVVVGAGMACAPMAARADGPAPNRSQAKFETDWMKRMIDHHHMAVMMGELCAERAVHPELIAMCEEMVASQLGEIGQMQTWLQDWYEVQHEPQMKPGDERMITRMAALEDEEFEVAFMDTMIRHHLQAIREGTLAVRRAYHPELTEMAADIVQMQAAEVAQLREWLCEWYERCQGSGPQPGTPQIGPRPPTRSFGQSIFRSPPPSGSWMRGPRR